MQRQGHSECPIKSLCIVPQVLEYTRAAVNVFDDTDLTSKTSQPALTGVAYVDKHTQPSDDTTFTTLLQGAYGQITAAG
jgi:hypothetical protein